MASLQHVYRRGHIFWWRRIHFSHHNKRIDVRLSLGTPDRLQARNRGAVLTAAYDRVTAMLNQRLREDCGLTEHDIQRIARDMYGERLAELCTAQRASPSDADMLSAANRAYVDYFARLQRQGGHASLLAAEERQLQAAGWDEDRIDDLKAIICQREDRGIDPIRSTEIDRHLAQAGFEADDRLRWTVQLALYPAYRDAYAEADRRLHARSSFQSNDKSPQPMPVERADELELSVPEDWRELTPTQVAERMIAETPRLLEHRRDGKRSSDSVGEQTLRQIRWAATLLEKSLPPKTPLWHVQESDIRNLDMYFDRLPVHFGKSDKDRVDDMTLAIAVELAADRELEGDLKTEDVGFSIGTSNKHYNKLDQIHKFLRRHVKAAEAIDYSQFTANIKGNESEARLGCQSARQRGPGSACKRVPPSRRRSGVCRWRA